MIFCIIAENEMELCYKALEIQHSKDAPIVPHDNTLGNPPTDHMTMTTTCFGEEKEENTSERLGGQTVCWNEEKCVCVFWLCDIHSCDDTMGNYCVVQYCFPGLQRVCTSK